MSSGPVRPLRFPDSQRGLELECGVCGSTATANVIPGQGCPICGEADIRWRVRAADGSSEEVPRAEVGTVVDDEMRIDQLAPRFAELAGELPPNSRVALATLEREQKRLAEAEDRQRREREKLERARRADDERQQRQQEKRQRQRAKELDRRESEIARREKVELDRLAQRERIRHNRVTHPLAAISFASCFVVSPLIGAPLGMVALNMINAQPNVFKGRGWAYAAIGLGVASVVLFVLAMLVIFML